ncbi:hypothetical protein niasHT_015474 [Heterodera trifolii]|uniref:Uncharacterized protein n=1 Tax=Heterodera trifolii TaxID=157864 RepID=A0ABD2L0W5_9BILA
MWGKQGEKIDDDDDDDTEGAKGGEEEKEEDGLGGRGRLFFCPSPPIRWLVDVSLGSSSPRANYSSLPHFPHFHPFTVPFPFTPFPHLTPTNSPPPFHSFIRRRHVTLTSFPPLPPLPSGPIHRLSPNFAFC